MIKTETNDASVDSGRQINPSHSPAAERLVDAVLGVLPECYWPSDRDEIVADVQAHAEEESQDAAWDYLGELLRETVVAYIRRDGFVAGHCTELYDERCRAETKRMLGHPNLRAQDREWICDELHFDPDAAVQSYVGTCSDCGAPMTALELSQSLPTCSRELCGTCYREPVM